MTEQKQDMATARPWKVWTDGAHISIVDANQPLEVCSITLYKNSLRHQANAELIVKAVNEYSALCAIAETADEIKEFCQCPNGGYHENWSCLACDQIEAFRKALATLAKLRS